MSAFNLRRATTNDAAALAALSIQVWLDTYAAGVNELWANYVLQEFTVAKMHAQLQNQACWLVEQDESILGYVLLGNLQARTEYGDEVLRFYIQARYQGIGIGRALFQILQQEVNTFYLKVYHANEKAIGFYHHIGMRKVGSTFFELGEDKHENYILAFGEGSV